MQLVTDNSADISAEQLTSLTIDIHRVSLTLTLDGKSYESGVDIETAAFYELMEKSEDMPTTSQPSPGDILKTYREVAEKTGDKEILSVHISSGLSGTMNAVRIAAEQAKADGITVHMIDTMTLSGPQGWQVEAAARGVQAGWDVERIRTTVDRVRRASDTIFTLPTLKYLIHGGRISHLQGLVASTLGIRPIIGVNPEDGKYETRARIRTYKKAVRSLPDVMAERVEPGSKVRVQPVNALYEDVMEDMKKAIDKKFDVEWMPAVPLSPILGAHTGAGMLGVAYGAVADLPELP
ncbi:MAG: DegV family protein [Chloroflexota bacterium]